MFAGVEEHDVQFGSENGQDCENSSIPTIPVSFRLSKKLSFSGLFAS